MLAEKKTAQNEAFDLQPSLVCSAEPRRMSKEMKRAARPQNHIALFAKQERRSAVGHDQRAESVNNHTSGGKHQKCVGACAREQAVFYHGRATVTIAGCEKQTLLEIKKKRLCVRWLGW